MQEDFRLIIDLVTVLGVAAIGGLLAALLRQPVLLGYLLAGMIVGPAGLGIIKEVVQVETLAQFGVAFLLFALGVSFSLSELKKVQAISLGGGGLQIVLTILATAGISLGVGWVTSPAQGMFLGGILSLSSTAVVLRCLMDRNETESTHGQVMLGILVVQDLAVGLMLAVLPALDKPPEEIGLAIGWALAQIAMIAAGAIVAGIWVIPRLLRLLARTESRELFLLGVVVLCLSIALLTEQLGLSIEMGAFIAGLMISEVEYADQTLAYVEPLRDIFATLFFASIGILIDPVFLWNNLELILGLVALVILGKFLLITPLVKAFGYSWKTAILTGVGLAQIGEFSFVLASEGQSLGLVSRQVYLLILGTTAVTLVATPFIVKAVPQLFLWAEAVPWLQAYLSASEEVLDSSSESRQNHIIICGYGRVGQSIVQLLQEYEHPVLVIDQNESVVQQLREAKIPYIYGNAASPQVLDKAKVNQALGMAITLPDPMSIRLCLKRSLEFAPDLDVIVKAKSDRDIELLYQLGAKEVVQPEFEASLELSAHLLFGIGLPELAIQQQVQQIRNSHYLDFRSERPAYAVARELRMAAREMNSGWYDLPDDSPLVGLTLAETELRRLTGVTLMAILRDGGEELDYPNHQTLLKLGDRLLVVGQPEERLAFRELMEGKVTLPVENSACQWLSLPFDSTAVGKTLADLSISSQYRVLVQAIRREGKFMRFPSDQTDLQAGDRLLLCGAADDLPIVSDLLTTRRLPISLPLTTAVETVPLES
ncbi:MAG: cation:proton antiporter [Aphanocapsa sp. GSE-SYN-MK-11-07L]|nr:cation:proton antiporter [Aphanocapsa sp. GSE-SYN-MK-11-07L]